MLTEFENYDFLICYIKIYNENSTNAHKLLTKYKWYKYKQKVKLVEDTYFF